MFLQSIAVKNKDIPFDTLLKETNQNNPNKVSLHDLRKILGNSKFFENISESSLKKYKTNVLSYSYNKIRGDLVCYVSFMDYVCSAIELLSFCSLSDCLAVKIQKSEKVIAECIDLSNIEISSNECDNYLGAVMNLLYRNSISKNSSKNLIPIISQLNYFDLPLNGKGELNVKVYPFLNFLQLAAIKAKTVVNESENKPLLTTTFGDDKKYQTTIDNNKNPIIIISDEKPSNVQFIGEKSILINF